MHRFLLRGLIYVVPPLPRPQLLEAIKPLKRGLTASEEDKQRIDRLARQVERRNPTKKPLASGGQGRVYTAGCLPLYGTAGPCATLRAGGWAGGAWTA